MKNLNTISLSSFLLFSLAVFVFNQQNSGQRVFASKKDIHSQRCHKQLEISLSASQKKKTGYGHYGRKRKRTKLYEKLIKLGDLPAVKKLFWNTYSNERIDKVPDDSKFFLFFRTTNLSTEVPAIHQVNSSAVSGLKGEKIETYSTIYHLTDHRKEESTAEVKAIANVRSWMAHLEKLKSRIDPLLDDALESYQAVLSLKDQGFSQKGIEEGFHVPKIIDGKLDLKGDTYQFQSEAQYKKLIAGEELVAKSIFATSRLRERTHSSKLYRVMEDQAIYFERCRLAYDKLYMTRDSLLTPNQIQLRSDLKAFLDRSDIKPRKDIYLAFRKKQARFEFYKALRFWKSKRVQSEDMDTDLDIPDALKIDNDSISPFALVIYPVFAIITSSFVASMSFLQDVMIEDRPRVRLVFSTVRNYWHNTWFNIVGTSMPLRECIFSNRKWTREEISQSNIAMAHTSRFQVRSIIYPEKDYLNSLQYKVEIDNLLAVCNRENDIQNAQEFHQSTKDALKSEIVAKLTFHITARELIEKSHPQGIIKGKLLSAKIYEYFQYYSYYNPHYTHADAEKIEPILKKIREEIRALDSTNLFEQVMEMDRVLTLYGEGIIDLKDYHNPALYKSANDFFDAINKLKAVSSN